MNINELSAALQESEDMRETIGRSAEMFGVALLAGREKAGMVDVRLVGSGTLYEHHGTYYVLTARHVWEEELRKADMLWFSLRESDVHQHYVDIKTIVATGPPAPEAWNPWGPDLVFLRIPPEQVGALKAFRVFYVMPENVAEAPTNEFIRNWALFGAPAAFSKQKQTHLEFEINILFVKEHGPAIMRAGYDYHEYELPLDVLEGHTSFGGLSGGGLWRIDSFVSPSTGRPDSIATLFGVIFYETEIVNGNRTIRCHGPQSIASALSLLP
jgi:hypothetical protein